ncbi:MAG: dimethylsulfonioproprionate lyase family protein, partial [Paracoccaceae bacterium]
MTTSDPLRLIQSPLGVPGSGRVRYGAAMALWRDSLISAEVLEVYRVTAAHDTRDPALVLRELGLPLPPQSAMETPIKALYTAARDYILTLDHPGAADVRAGLPVDPGPGHRVPARRNTVVDQWLAPALGAMDRRALAQAIGTAADHLEWITYTGYPRAEIGAGFQNAHAYAMILGGDAPFRAQNFDLGLFLIAPDVLYRDHRHAAPELYAPLTGPHGWRFGPAGPLTLKPAHLPVWNPPHQPHLTKTGAVPFLAFFVWTKDVNELAHVIAAPDWAELEAMKIA